MAYMLSDAEKKMNKLWDMYGSGELETIDYNAFIVCDYESGVNGEGHSGWFFNVENTEGIDTLRKIVSSLSGVLPAHIGESLKKAFDSYGAEDEDDACNEADDYFYEHEQEVIDYLQSAADALEL